MESRAEFVQAWFAWKRIERPNERFRSGQRAAVTFDLECELDHLATWVYSLGNAFISGAERDYQEQARSLLEEVEGAEQHLSTLALEETDRGRYTSFLLATKDVLRALCS